MLITAWLTIILAFTFTFTNGFQDASSIAATFIASRSGTPKKGIIFVALMSFSGALLGGSAVAFTLSGLLTIDSGAETLNVLFITLISAIFWNFLTWKYALPSSSTHALIGGLLGAGIAAAGTGSVFWGLNELLTPPHELTGLVKVILFFVISILIGLTASYIMRKTTSLILRNAKRSVNKSIIKANWLAVGLMAVSNGSNDSQKQLGIIALVLLSAGITTEIEMPFWARGLCAVLLALGTVGGGWRIMNTLGHRIFKVKPIHSFDSQVSSGLSIALSTIAGAPISSTHIITSSVIGVGAAENRKKVNWGVGKDIIIAMAVTIPITMIISGILYYAIFTLGGLIL